MKHNLHNNNWEGQNPSPLNPKTRKGKETMKTPINTAEALERIQTQGLDNSEYNIELKSVDPRTYYGATNRNEELPPHVAVFLDNIEDLADWPYCCCCLDTKDLGSIAIYPL